MKFTSGEDLAARAAILLQICLILLVKIMLYNKLNCQTVFNLKHISCKVLQRGFSVCIASSNELVQSLGFRV